MSGWDEVKASTGGGGLLPKGTRSYRIAFARVEVSERGAKLRELVIGLEDSEGHSGQTTVALEPFDRSAKGIELWESLFKGAAQGLGFEPTVKTAEIIDVADEFARWIPGSGLVGLQVEAYVKHVEAKPKEDGSHLKDDGTPFVNHRVTFRGIVGGTPAPGGSAFGQGGSPAASFAQAGATNHGEDPWT